MWQAFTAAWYDLFWGRRESILGTLVMKRGCCHEPERRRIVGRVGCFTCSRSCLVNRAAYGVPDQAWRCVAKNFKGNFSFQQVG